MSLAIKVARLAVQEGLRTRQFNPTPRRGTFAPVRTRLPASAGFMGSGPGISSPVGRRIVAAGDPGLFGFIGDRFKDLAGLALSAIKTTPVGSALIAGAGAVLGTLGGRQVSTNDPAVIARLGGTQQTVVRPGVGEVALFTQEVIQEPGIGGAIARFLPGGSTGLIVAPGAVGAGCPTGSHLNKSSYFLMDGTFVPKGSRCVANRRRNPLNPRAFDRALGRITAAKKFGARLGRVTIRKKC